MNNRPDLWIINLENTSVEQISKNFADLLSQKELLQASKFVNERDSILHLAGRLFTRVLAFSKISEIYAKENKAVDKKQLFNNLDIEAEQLGKPRFNADFVANFGDFKFNISHHWPWVVIGFDLRYNIGVDVIVIDQKSKHEVANLVTEIELQLHNDETRMLKAYLGSDDTAESVEILCKIWAAKEAVSKLGGFGMVMSYSDLFVDVFQSNSNTIKVTETKTKQIWYVYLIMLLQNQWIAVSSERFEDSEAQISLVFPEINVEYKRLSDLSKITLNSEF